MRLDHVLTLHRIVVLGLLATLAIASADGAQARTHRQHKIEKKHARVVHGPDYKPPYAAIVVDDKSGQVLHEVKADEPRHPASLTKIMTLYLLFEQLESGKIKLDTPLPISAHAAAAAPVKLGLKPNGTIKAEEALKAMVTKSANDAAVVVSEAIGGTEEEFAKLMTEKAKSLGMASTVYVNASGLPAEEQITTARDQALLGRAIGHRFPTYYRYFATPSFSVPRQGNAQPQCAARTGKRRRRHQDRLHGSLRLQSRRIRPSRREAPRRGGTGRHVECAAEPACDNCWRNIFPTRR